jgi:hypothetical protein
MTSRVLSFAALAFGLTLFAACASGQQNSQPGSAVVPFTHQVNFSSIVPDKPFCGGTGGVSVTPCPVKLTKKTRKKGVVVTVGGPGVAEAGIYYDSCYPKCYYTNDGSSYLMYVIKSGPYCGDGRMGFNAVNASGQPVGDGYLEVVNKYCPPGKSKSQRRLPSTATVWQPPEGGHPAARVEHAHKKV